MKGERERKVWLYSGLLVALLAAPLQAHAIPISLGTAGDFNTFIFGDFSGYSDTQGRLAVGGNAYLEGYSVGKEIDPPGGSALVVGGDLTLTSGNIFNGDAYVGGTVIEPNYNPVVDGDLNVGGALPIDFTAEATYLTDLSSSLSGEAANGESKLLYGDNLLLQGDDTQSDLQIFDVLGSDLLAASVIKMEDIPEDATVLLNISGETSGFNEVGYEGGGIDPSNILYNFYETTSLDINKVGVQGSILAPLAAIDARNGVISGTTIGASWNGPVQQNQALFTPYTTQGGPAPVPEPVSMLLFGTGLVGISGSLLKRRKNSDSYGK